ncbi:unnamed protein product [Lampetra planeri]
MAGDAVGRCEVAVALRARGLCGWARMYVHATRGPRGPRHVGDGAPGRDVRASSRGRSGSSRSAAASIPSPPGSGSRQQRVNRAGRDEMDDGPGSERSGAKELNTSRGVQGAFRRGDGAGKSARVQQQQRQVPGGIVSLDGERWRRLGAAFSSGSSAVLARRVGVPDGARFIRGGDPESTRPRASRWRGAEQRQQRGDKHGRAGC